jgi:hypothetical protein
MGLDQINFLFGKWPRWAESRVSCAARIRAVGSHPRTSFVVPSLTLKGIVFRYAEVQWVIPLLLPVTISSAEANDSNISLWFGTALRPSSRSSPDWLPDQSLSSDSDGTASSKCLPGLLCCELFPSAKLGIARVRPIKAGVSAPTNHTAGVTGSGAMKGFRYRFL